MRRLLAVLFTILVSLPARAAEIAVLDFDSYGLNYDDSALVSQGFRDAFLEQGGLFPLEGYDITDRLSTGHEENLSRARKLIADARTYLNNGRAGEAIVMLEEAELLHKRAGSDIARRAQIADVYFFMGQAQLRLGRSSSAHKSFVEMLNCYPGYAETRAGAMTSSVNASISRAKTARINQNRDLMEPMESATLARRIRVQAVLVGVVDGQGNLKVRLTQNGRIQGEISRSLESVPPFPGDPVYTEMVRELALNLSTDAGGGGFSPPPRFDTPPPDDFDTPPRFDTPPPRGDSVDQTTTQGGGGDSTPDLPDSIGKVRRPWWQFWKRDQAPVTGRINVGGSAGPVTQQWWFWAATGAVFAGGTTAAVVLLSDGEGTDDPGQGGSSVSYTLNIEVD